MLTRPIDDVAMLPPLSNHRASVPAAALATRFASTSIVGAATCAAAITSTGCAGVSTSGSSGAVRRLRRLDAGNRRRAIDALTGGTHDDPSDARPGYVVDHIVALKRGGRDAPSTMERQTIEVAKAKDRRE